MTTRRPRTYLNLFDFQDDAISNNWVVRTGDTIALAYNLDGLLVARCYA